MARTTGTPTWVDLAITRESTAEFYSDLLGWRFEDAGEGMGGYRLIRAGDALVGGMMDVSRIDPEMPSPLVWDVFLAVDDADARVERARELGGRVIVPPSDIEGEGRHAIIEDPAGARVGLWQAGALEGYEATMAPGTPVWFELMTADYEGAVDFYREVFDFAIDVMADEADGFRYASNGAGESAVCGICDASAWLGAEDKPYWRIYFEVEDVDDAIARVASNGGALLDGPERDTPYGTFATVADPEGATFQINQSPDPAAAL